MGIGAKIKEALHGDQSVSDVKAPGAYPDDEPVQRHSGGKEYNATHGDLINKKWDNTGPAGASDQAHTDTGTGTGTGNTSATSHGGNLMSSSGAPRNKLHKDTEEYHPTQESYSQPTHGHHAQDSGVSLGRQTSTKDSASQGAYWGDISSEGHHGQGRTDDFPDRTYRGQDHTGAAGRSGHNPRFEDQAVGGGVYSTSVTGAGNPGHSGSYGKSHTAGGTVHDPLTSGTKGTSIPSGNAYDQKTDRQGHSIPTSRNDHTGHTGHNGAGLAGAGAGAGAAAGYAANEYSHRGRDNTGYNSSENPAARDTYAPGAPHSSMLDPEPGLSNSATYQSHQVPGTHSTAPHNSGNMSTAASGTGLGKDHYGPAHEGAKVMHTCQHCGQDNDISQYFKKEAVYRLGS